MQRIIFNFSLHFVILWYINNAKYIAAIQFLFNSYFFQRFGWVRWFVRFLVLDPFSSFPAPARAEPPARVPGSLYTQDDEQKKKIIAQSKPHFSSQLLDLVFFSLRGSTLAHIRRLTKLSSLFVLKK